MDLGTLIRTFVSSEHHIKTVVPAPAAFLDIHESILFC